MERSKLTIFFQINIKSIKVRRRKNTRPGHIVPDCPFSSLFDEKNVKILQRSKNFQLFFIHNAGSMTAPTKFGLSILMWR